MTIPAGVRGRLVTLGVVAAVLLATAAIVELAGPYVLLKTGLGNGYEVGTLRRGRAEYAKRLVVTDQYRSRRAGIAYVREGESLRVEWDAVVRKGTPTLRIVPFPGSGDPHLWRASLHLRPRGDTAVAIPASGLYQIRVSWTRWAGTARIRWHVERAAYDRR